MSVKGSYISVRLVFCEIFISTRIQCCPCTLILVYLDVDIDLRFLLLMHQVVITSIDFANHLRSWDELPVQLGSLLIIELSTKTKFNFANAQYLNGVNPLRHVLGIIILQMLIQAKSLMIKRFMRSIIY